MNKIDQKVFRINLQHRLISTVNTYVMRGAMRKYNLWISYVISRKFHRIKKHELFACISDRKVMKRGFSWAKQDDQVFMEFLYKKTDRVLLILIPHDALTSIRLSVEFVPWSHPRYSLKSSTVLPIYARKNPRLSPNYQQNMLIGSMPWWSVVPRFARLSVIGKTNTQWKLTQIRGLTRECQIF